MDASGEYAGIKVHPLSVTFRSPSVEGEYLMDVARSRLPVLTFIFCFDLACYLFRFVAKLVSIADSAGTDMWSSALKIGVEVCPQLANMVLLYTMISLLNRRSRKHGDTAARQEELVLSVLMAMAICNLLASLGAGSPQDYVYAAFFLVCTTTLLKLRWWVGTLVLATPVVLLNMWQRSKTAHISLPPDAQVHIFVAWAIGGLMAYLVEWHRRQMFSQQCLAAASHQKELLDAQARVRAQRRLAAVQLQARVRAQRQLAAAQAQAAQRALVVARDKAAHDAQIEFMSLMCHEVRTPLNGCLASAEMLLETALSPEQHELANTIKVSGSILLSTVSNFLDFFKMEAGKTLDIVRTEVDLLQLVHDVHCIIEAMIGRSGNVRLLHPEFIIAADNVNADGNMHIICDPDRVRGILLNLYTNAAKFTRQGHIGLRVQEVRGQYEPDPGTAYGKVTVTPAYQPSSSADQAAEGKPSGPRLAGAGTAYDIAFMAAAAASPTLHVGTGKTTIASSASLEDEADKAVTASSTSLEDEVDKTVMASGTYLEDEVDKTVMASGTSLEDEVDKTILASGTSLEDEVDKTVLASGTSLEDEVDKVMVASDISVALPTFVSSGIVSRTASSTTSPRTSRATGAVSLSQSQPPTASSSYARLASVWDHKAQSETAAAASETCKADIASTCSALSIADENARWLLFEVMDTGVGISQEGLHALFKEYCQGTEAEMRKPRSKGGTGLGLSICSKQVAVLGGRIGAYSCPDKGSVFWFTIPLILPPPPLAEEPLLSDPETSALAGGDVLPGSPIAQSAAIPTRATASQVTHPCDADASSDAAAVTDSLNIILQPNCEDTHHDICSAVTQAAAHGAGPGHTTVALACGATTTYGHTDRQGHGGLETTPPSTATDMQQQQQPVTFTINRRLSHSCQHLVPNAGMPSDPLVVGSVRLSQVARALSRVRSDVSIDAAGRQGSGDAGTGSIPALGQSSPLRCRSPASPTSGCVLSGAVPRFSCESHHDKLIMPAGGISSCSLMLTRSPGDTSPGISTLATTTLPPNRHSFSAVGPGATGHFGAASSNAVLAALRGRRVLLVEDNLINQTVARKMLAGLGMQCTVASNGLEAVTAVQSTMLSQESTVCAFDVVLMDMMMPVMGGVEATRRIRELEAAQLSELHHDAAASISHTEVGSSLSSLSAMQPSPSAQVGPSGGGALFAAPTTTTPTIHGGRSARVPILAMTANASDRDRDECRHAGMDGFLSKPVLKDRLAEAILQVLTGEHCNRQYPTKTL